MVTLSDHELALSALGGETEAFGELVQRYQASVFNVCYRLVGERREAEDLTQEAFIRAYQRFDLYDVERPIGPWVRRVAANLCLNRLQSQQAGRISLDEERELEDEQDRATPVDADRPLDNPEALRQQAETAEAVRQALLSLPPHYRVVVELRHFQELSYAEIADLLKIPISDVKSHLFRARQLLAKRLKPYG
jgi:RNA polymerase sigma-70 factor (ECF subfamily)